MIKRLEDGRPAFVPNLSLMGLLLASWNLLNNGWVARYMCINAQGENIWWKRLNPKYAELPLLVRIIIFTVVLSFHVIHACIGLAVETLIRLLLPRSTVNTILEEKDIWRSIAWR